MTRVVLVSTLVALTSVSAMEQPNPSTAALIARAKALEIDTPYVAPPGEALQHHASGFAKIMCSAVFVTGLDPDFAAENVGYFTAPYDVRAKLGKPIIDRAGKQVHVTMPNGVRRTAKYLGKLGCVTSPLGTDGETLPPGTGGATLPPGRGGASASANASADRSAPPGAAPPEALGFTPVDVKSTLPDPDTQPWPMGDAAPKDPLPTGLDVAKVKQAVDAAFEPAEGMTAAFVVTWRGRIVGERYGNGITMHTPLESWSMGKSLTATLMGVLIKQGAYTLEQPAPIPEWQQAGDPRAKITIADILHMSSGLRARAPQDPDFDPTGPYPDHLYYYTGDNAFRWAATRPSSGRRTPWVAIAIRIQCSSTT